MDRKVYERTTERQLIGRRVRSRVPLANSLCRFPAGTIFAIKRKFKGLELRSEQCPTCGIQTWISRVPPSDVDFINEA